MQELNTLYLMLISNRVYLLWRRTKVAELHSSALQASADGSTKCALCCTVVSWEPQSTEEGKIALFGNWLEVRNPAFLNAEMCTVHTAVYMQIAGQSFLWWLDRCHKSAKWELALIVLLTATEFIKWDLDPKGHNLPVPWDFNVSKTPTQVDVYSSLHFL